MFIRGCVCGVMLLMLASGAAPAADNAPGTPSSPPVDSVVWRYSRIVDGLVVDQGSLSVDRPGMSHVAAPAAQPGAPELEFIVIRYGQEVEPWRAPTFKAGEWFYFGYAPGVGSISAKQVNAKEKWVFNFGGADIESKIPVQVSSLTFSFEYQLDGHTIQEGDSPLQPGQCDFTECTDNKTGKLVKCLLMARSGVGQKQVKAYLAKYDFLSVPVPEELGWFAIWPKVKGATCTVYVGGQKFTATAD